MDRRESGTKSRRKGRTAQLRVQALFDDWGWDAREDVPDNGYDFNVEAQADPSSPTFRFLVQVKSSGEFSVRNDGSWSVPLKRSRLLEYRRHRLPVMVVAVDLASLAFRWCAVDDAQSVVPPRKRASNRNQTKTKSKLVYLRLVEDHELSHSRKAEFVAAVESAWQRRSDLHHPPVIAARVRQELLKQKDSRFDVTLNVINGAEVRIIQPRDKPVMLSATIQFENMIEAEAFRDSYRFGIPATIRTPELRISGSGLFEEMPSAGTLSVGGKSKRRRLLFGYPDHNNSSEVHWVIDEDGEQFFGAEGGEWQIECPALPLRIRMRVNILTHTILFTFSLDQHAWSGIDLQCLPYFDAILRLINGVLESESLSIATRVNGEIRALETVPIMSHRALFKSIGDWLQCVVLLRTICRWANKSVSWKNQAQLDIAEIETWNLGARIIAGERINYGPSTFIYEHDEDVVFEIEPTNGKYLLRTALQIRYENEQVAEIPVLITLSNYHVSRGNAAGELIFERTPSSRPSMRLDVFPEEEISESLARALITEG
jgi:hypothetical protein